MNVRFKYVAFYGSFHMLGFIHILLSSEGYFLLFVINLVLLGLVTLGKTP